MLQLDELQKKFGIGLTGGIACGKSTVAHILRDLGYLVIDADHLSRKSVEPGTKWLARIVETFGGLILNEDGTLNRNKLREIIFDNADARKKLEGIIHPAVYELLVKELTTLNVFNEPKYWFFESPLLVEIGIHQHFRSIWMTHCPFAMQIARVQKRDKISAALAEKIIMNQLDQRTKATHADILIDTSGPLEELEAKVKRALKETLK